ncbi:MAG: hypothetical protein KKD17_05970 [Nanoarchaeota archaeon]|nr:hypothetical protein [Nanoarchaeota archaeon]
MTDGVGSIAGTLDDVLQTITTRMPQTTERQKEFCDLVCEWYKTMEQVRESSDGHGVTMVVWDGRPSLFEEYLKQARPFNGVMHNVKDPDTPGVIANKRHRDAAMVSDPYGNVIGANVALPLDTVEMSSAYGLNCLVADFMGYAENEDLGMRAASALWATKKFPEVVIMTLGENAEDGTKGPIRVYFRGDLVQSTDGKELRWDCARPDARPGYGCKIVPLDRHRDYMPEHYCCQGQYEKPTAAVAAGNI